MNSLKNKEVLYPKLSYTIIGAAMKVHNQLGPGWDEESYHFALLHALRKQGLRAESKQRGVLKHRDQAVDTFELDIFVEDLIVLELKHLIGGFDPAHTIQLINYLKFWEKELGMLINFGLDRLRYERIPFTPRTGSLQQNDAYIRFCQKTPTQAEKIKSVFEVILNDHGLGYGTYVYQNLFQAECLFQNFTCHNPIISLSYDSSPLGEKKADAFCVDSNTLVSVTALRENTSAVHLARMLSYLRQTGMTDGILANFGIDKLDLRYVSL